MVPMAKGLPFERSYPTREEAWLREIFSCPFVVKRI